MESEINYKSVLEELTELSPDVFCHYNESEFKTRAIADRPKAFIGAGAAPTLPNTSTAKLQLQTQQKARIRFLVPHKPAGRVFPTKFEEDMTELGLQELTQSVWSELAVSQWNEMASWIMQAVDYLKLPLTIVPVALNIADRYVYIVSTQSNPDLITVACAALYRTTKSRYQVLSLLEYLSAFSNRTPQAIMDMETQIINALNWDSELVTSEKFIDMFDLEVFSTLYSPLERQSMKSLVETLLKEAYSDFDISHFSPSSIAFGYILTMMAVLDPRGVKRVNTADILLLANRQNFSMNEIQQCVESFVEFLNETFAGILRFKNRNMSTYSNLF